MSGELIYNQKHLLNRIIFFFKGLQTPSAIAMNEAKKKKELITDIADLGEVVEDFYKDDISDEYVIVDNTITFLYIAITPLPVPQNEFLIPPLIYGSFFRHNLFSYRERDFGIEEYHLFFEFVGIIPADDSDDDYGEDNYYIEF